MLPLPKILTACLLMTGLALAAPAPDARNIRLQVTAFDHDVTETGKSVDFESTDEPDVDAEGLICLSP